MPNVGLRTGSGSHAGWRRLKDKLLLRLIRLLRNVVRKIARHEPEPVRLTPYGGRPDAPERRWPY